MTRVGENRVRTQSVRGIHSGAMPPPKSLPPGLFHWYSRPDPAEVTSAELRLMALHAHPDDEASKGAGTVARYAARGVRCTLVTATGGEEGDILNSAMAAEAGVAERIDEIRLEELSEAVAVCGYAAAYLLGFRDSGMADSEANARPEALANADHDEAVGRLVSVIRAERPHVLLGYDDHKRYPHPDHVAVHRLGLEAWDAAGDPDFAVDGIDLGEPWTPQKLYWFHWSFARVRRMHEEFTRRGWESPFGEWVEHGIDEDHAVTSQIDVSDLMDVRRKALVAHRTQIDPDSWWLRLPDDVLADLHPHEDYVLARDRTGALGAGGLGPDSPETDIFSGVAP